MPTAFAISVLGAYSNLGHATLIRLFMFRELDFSEGEVIDRRRVDREPAAQTRGV